MAQFEIKENPIYNGDMTKIETSTPVHASVMNQKFGQLLENDAHLIKEKAEKIHGHFIHDMNNILFEIRDNPSASIGKYTRIMESVLVNKANSGAYARYQVQFDYSNYFEIDISIQQDKLLTEDVPKVYVSSYNCPNWVGVYVTVQSDPDWQLYDIDLYLKIEKQFNKMKLRELSQNGNTSVLTHHDAYKVIDRLEDRQNLVKIIEATKYIVLSIEEKEAMQNIQLVDSKISVADKENHFTATKLDGVLNELFQYASDGKLAITTVAGLANNSTFQVIANELTEWKRLVAEAGGVCATNENMRTQAAKIVEYVRTHLPTIITTNGGSLVNSAGAGVTAVTSTLDTIYHSINNLAVVKNNQINAVTNEKNQLVANYNDMVNQKNTWYQNYVNMEVDRNNWMNLANSKKSYFKGNLNFSGCRFTGDTTTKATHTINIGFIPAIVYCFMYVKHGTEGGSSYIYSILGGSEVAKINTDNLYRCSASIINAELTITDWAIVIDEYECKIIAWS